MATYRNWYEGSVTEKRKKERERGREKGDARWFFNGGALLYIGFNAPSFFISFTRVLNLPIESPHCHLALSLSCHIISYPILSDLILSYPVISYLILSCAILI